MIENLVRKLEKRPLLNWVLILLYSIFILFAHGWFVEVSVAIMKSLSIPVYNTLVAMVAGAVLIVLSWGVFLSLRNHQKQLRAKLFFFSLIIAALGAHRYFLSEMNIEIIHALEFGILAVFFFPITRRFGAAVIMSIPIMMVDEWYQYQVLYPEFVQYFDLNDIVLDMLGSGLLVLLLWIFGAQRAASLSMWKRGETYLFLTIFGAIIFGLQTCFLSEFPIYSCNNTWLVLNTIGEQLTFWRVHPDIGSIYHVLSLKEGLMVILLLGFLFVGMDTASTK